jgi:GNAT superfamily N-acetyltransferase
MTADATAATVRAVQPHDIASILEMIRSLADHDGFLEKVTATDAQLTEAFFCESPAVFALVVENEGTLVGHAIWYKSFGGWTAQHGIWLLELYVKPEHRHRGHGRALLKALLDECRANNYYGLVWRSEKGNQSAHDFYRHLGANSLDQAMLFSLPATASL